MTKGKDARAVRHARLLDWMVEMAKAVGARRTPREDVAAVFERLAAAALTAEYEATTAETKARAKRRGEK